MKENINALDEINKGAQMGIDAISFIIDKIKNDEFKKLVEIQDRDYKDVSKRVGDIYDNYNSEDDPHTTSMMNKAMTFSMVEMKTLTDHSDSKIAELLLQGTNMGIIEGVRILNNKKLDQEVEDILREFIKMQEKSVEDLKKYL